MPYTLAMFFLWGLGMALIGAVIGWLLRSLSTRGARTRPSAGEQDVAHLQRLAELEPVEAERDRLRIELADVRGSSAGALGFSSSAELDLDAAGALLDRDVVLDDLTVVEGIGPKVAALCAGIGVTTWRQLADVDPAALQVMLDDAGSNFSTYVPTTWPEQAGLLADGRWEEFKGFVDGLGGGR